MAHIFNLISALSSAKFDGVLKLLGKKAAPLGWINSLASEIMNDKQKKSPQRQRCIWPFHSQI
ncbi:MAG: hypothetical protein ACI823_002170 [Chitinophagales bacterium]|jgi:hypothetical protein